MGSSPKIPINARRGFFFTVLALILVSFMMISVQLWAAAQVAQEQRASTRFNLEALRTSLALVGDQSLSNFANASMIYAITKLSLNIENNTDISVLGLSCDTGGGVCTLGSGLFPDGTASANKSIYELMMNGSTAGSNTRGNYALFSPNLSYAPEEQKYQMSNYFNTTRAAAELLGYQITWGTPTNFTFNQTDAYTLNVYFNVPVTLTDSQNRLSVNKMLHANASLSINGLTDPYVMRQDIAYRPGLPIAQRPHRNVYIVPEYNSSDDAKARLIARPTADATEGIGWFYGPVTDLDNNSFTPDGRVYNLSRISQFIFKTDNASKAVEMSRYFGAILFTGSYQEDDPASVIALNSTVNGNCNYTTYTQTHCINCLLYTSGNGSPGCPSTPASVDINPLTIPVRTDIPYIAIKTDLPPVTPNFALQLPEVLIQNNNNYTTVFGNPPRYTNLPLSQALSKFSEDTTATPYNLQAKSRVYDLNGPRDMAICGFYVRSYFGPSYLQRWVALPPYQSGIRYSRTNEGIESYVVGRWAAGADDPHVIANPSAERRSRIDYQFYQDSSNLPMCIGPFDKGLPGCKSAEACASDGPAKNATGRFAMSNLTASPPVYGWAGDPADRYNLTNITIDTSLGTAYSCQ